MAKTTKRYIRNKNGIAYCYTSNTDGTATRKLDDQEDRIRRKALEDGVRLRYIVKSQGQRVTLATLRQLIANTEDTSILYVDTADRLTRSYDKWTVYTESLAAMGIELAVAGELPDLELSDLLSRFTEDLKYVTHKKQTRRARRIQNICNHL